MTTRIQIYEDIKRRLSDNPNLFSDGSLHEFFTEELESPIDTLKEVFVDLDEIRRSGYTNAIFCIAQTKEDKLIKKGELLMLKKVVEFIDKKRKKYGLEAKIKEVEK